MKFRGTLDGRLFMFCEIVHSSACLDSLVISLKFIPVGVTVLEVLIKIGIKYENSSSSSFAWA